jgi:hypothetical protein
MKDFSSVLIGFKFITDMWGFFVSIIVVLILYVARYTRHIQQSKIVREMGQSRGANPVKILFPKPFPEQIPGESHGPNYYHQINYLCWSPNFIKSSQLIEASGLGINMSETKHMELGLWFCLFIRQTC